MKLKFRADPEDLAIFIAFAVFLLYLVALAVSNISSLATYGTLEGLNPFPAFSTENITTTLSFYIIALLALM